MKTAGHGNEKRTLQDERPGSGRCGLNRLQILRRPSTLWGCDAGNAIVETALSIPIMMTVITAIFQFGLVYNRMISLTQGTTVAAQVLQSDRLSATNDPCADTFNALKGAAPTLDPKKITITITINNGSALKQTTCAGSQTQLAQGAPVTVEATYPYTLSIVGLALASGTMDTGKISEIEY